MCVEVQMPTTCGVTQLLFRLLHTYVVANANAGGEHESNLMLCQKRLCKAICHSLARLHKVKYSRGACNIDELW